MKRNQHIGALVRIKALQLALGDKKKAEEILQWAYAEPSEGNGPEDAETDVGDATDTFIAKYLRVQEKTPRSEVRAFMGRYVKRHDESLDYGRISDRIGEMEYQDFLKTTYWRGVALAVKERDGKKCAVCGAEKDLSTHHLHYLNHGDELHHLEDLQCVCQSCHDKLHGREKRTPKTGSTLSMQAVLDAIND